MESFSFTIGFAIEIPLSFWGLGKRFSIQSLILPNPTQLKVKRDSTISAPVGRCVHQRYDNARRQQQDSLRGRRQFRNGKLSRRKEFPRFQPRTFGRGISKLHGPRLPLYAVSPFRTDKKIAESPLTLSNLTFIRPLIYPAKESGVA